MRKRLACGFVCLGLLPVAAWAQSGEVVDFDSERWTIMAGEVVTYLDQTALRGTAYLKDAEFSNGVVEFDVAVNGVRSFPGVVFRARDEQNTELFYIRPHRPKNYSHALQYTPIFNGLTGWQLYSGRGFTAAAEIPWDQWIHLRLEVAGRQARIFFDEMQTPAVVVTDLKRGEEAGFLGLVGPAQGQVHFANFSYTSSDDLDLGPAPIRVAPQGVITSWQLSQAYTLAQVNREVAPAAQGLELEWQDVRAERDGLVDIARHLVKNRAVPECAIVRTTIESERDQVKKLVFGYSDEVSVFLNGELLFIGESSFRSRDSEFMGVVGLNDAVPLRLNKGDNELLMVVAEAFGGWGVVARVDDVRRSTVSLSEGVTEKWSVAEGFRSPESVAYDPVRELLYVSNFNPAGPGNFGEQGFVSKVGLDGTILELEWIKGLRAPTGIAVHSGRVFVVERTGVAEIDPDGGEIVTRHPLPDDGLLNDIAIAGNGTIYVSDSRTGVIYRVGEDGAGEWVRHSALQGPNGLAIDGDRLVVFCINVPYLVSIALADGTVQSIVDFGRAMGDGVVRVAAGTYLVTDFAGRLMRVDSSGSATVLVDTQAAGVYLADFGFVPEANMVVIPVLRGNTVIAYDLGSAPEGS